MGKPLVKSATEYADAADKGHAYEPGCVTFDEAVAAVQAALDDAENYRNLLNRAIRHSTPPPCTCSKTIGN